MFLLCTKLNINDIKNTNNIIVKIPPKYTLIKSLQKRNFWIELLNLLNLSKII